MERSAKMSASWRKAVCCCALTGASGEAGEGWRSAWSKAWAATVDHYSSTGGSEGCTVKVECPMELGLRRQTGIDAGCSKKIERREGLRQQAIPEV